MKDKKREKEKKKKEKRKLTHNYTLDKFLKR